MSRREASKLDEGHCFQACQKTINHDIHTIYWYHKHLTKRCRAITERASARYHACHSEAHYHNTASKHISVKSLNPHHHNRGECLTRSRQKPSTEKAKDSETPSKGIWGGRCSDAVSWRGCGYTKRFGTNQARHLGITWFPNTKLSTTKTLTRVISLCYKLKD